MLNKVQSYNPNFNAARVNILATADNHGNVMSLPRLIKTVENNAKEIFPKSGERSTLNLFTIVGDWFINPSKSGFITHPEMKNGDLQNAALLKTIDHIRSIAAKEGSKHSDGNKVSPLEVLYTMGNHCLDAGTNFILGVMKKNPMKSVITNVNLEKSPAIKQAMEGNDNIVKSQVYAIPDDKNPDLTHHILFVSATIPSMDFYNPGLCEGLEFYDNSNRKDTSLEEKDLQGTIKSIKDEVDVFKEKYPKGAVILMSHMGAKLSEIVQKNVPQINHILNGHDHKNTQSNVGKTSINSLGKDNEMIKAINFEFDDKGDFIKATMTPYFTATTLADGLEKHPFQLFLNECFEKDLKPLITLDEVKTESNVEGRKSALPNATEKVLNNLGIKDDDLKERLMQDDNFKSLILSEAEKLLTEEGSVEKGLDKLTYGNEIRYSNSYLMNYLTSVIKSEIKHNINKDIFALGIQSSAIRGGLKNGADNLRVMKVFDGVSEDLSDLKIGDVKGEELAEMIIENVRENLKAPTRNTIMHWSDVQINRTMIDDILKGRIEGKLTDAVRVRNKITKQFEPIDLQETYKIVVSRKFLVKDDLKWPPLIRDRFESIHKTYDMLFRDFLERNDYKLHITPKAKEARII